MVVQMYSEARLLKKKFDEVPNESINVINVWVLINSTAIPAILERLRRNYHFIFSALTRHNRL